jgi:hypothetical protein
MHARTGARLPLASKCKADPARHFSKVVAAAAAQQKDEADQKLASGLLLSTQRNRPKQQAADAKLGRIINDDVKGLVLVQNVTFGV